MTTDDDAVYLPDAPAIPGLRFRLYRGEDDLPGIVAVNDALVDAGQLEFAYTVEFLANLFRHMPNCDPLRDVLMVEVDGEVIGSSRCWWEDEIGGPYVYLFNGNVTPAWQGRGITRALLRWAEGHCRQTAAGHPPDRPKVYQRWTTQGQTRVRAMLESEGYLPIRYTNSMVRPSLEDIPDFPLPEGLEVRPVTPAHYRAIWDAQDEAFRDHWGYSPKTDEDFQLWVEDPTFFQPDLWQVAWDVATNEVVGQVQTTIDHAENARFNRRRGYTENISVRRPWRRRGVARALIARSLRVQKEQGMTDSALRVDSSSQTGATRVYEDCGFRTEKVETVYRKPMTADTDQTG